MVKKNYILGPDQLFEEKNMKFPIRNDPKSSIPAANKWGVLYFVIRSSALISSFVSLDMGGREITRLEVDGVDNKK